jgi:hypothetical protein
MERCEREAQVFAKCGEDRQTEIFQALGRLAETHCPVESGRVRDCFAQKGAESPACNDYFADALACGAAAFVKDVMASAHEQQH